MQSKGSLPCMGSQWRNKAFSSGPRLRFPANPEIREKNTWDTFERLLKH